MRLKDSFAGVRVILISHDVPPIAARRRHNVTIGVDPVMRDFYAVTRSPRVIGQYAQSGDRGPVSMPDRKVCQRRYTRSTTGAAARTTREGDVRGLWSPRIAYWNGVPGVDARS